MRGLGTIINALAIVIAVCWVFCSKRFLKERYQDTMHQSHGLFRGVSWERRERSPRY